MSDNVFFFIQTYKHTESKEVAGLSYFVPNTSVQVQMGLQNYKIFLQSMICTTPEKIIDDEPGLRSNAKRNIIVLVEKISTFGLSMLQDLIEYLYG